MEKSEKWALKIGLALAESDTALHWLITSAEGLDPARRIGLTLSFGSPWMRRVAEMSLGQECSKSLGLDPGRIGLTFSFGSPWMRRVAEMSLGQECSKSLANGKGHNPGRRGLRSCSSAMVAKLCYTVPTVAPLRIVQSCTVSSLCFF